MRHSVCRRSTFAAVLFATGILAIAASAVAQFNLPAESPYSPKAVTQESLKLPLGVARVTSLRVEAPAAKAIEAVKQDNTRNMNKRLQIAVGRSTETIAEARSDALQWNPVPGGLAAQWEVTSVNAAALRVGLVAERMPPGMEIRFTGGREAGTVYGPFSERDVAASGSIYWSPVLEGDTATIEVFVPETRSPSDVALVIAQVSHLFASPSVADVESQSKAAGFCEVDLICRSATDAALASTGRSVARMTFMDGSGATFLCTGTLLNPTGGSFIPYFYSATHCISNQSVANTLTTHWFYDRTGCGTGGTSPSYVQLAGGATLLYTNAYFDALLLRLNSTPPTGAIFAGWDASTVSNGAALTAVHHPAGDLKKVSLGTMSGFSSPASNMADMLVSDWNSIATGVTEGGSSGSGIFTAVGQPATSYLLRGGLFGGPSSCTASAADLHDYYSRLDQVYPALAQYLNPATGTCAYTLSPTSVTVVSSATVGSVSVTATAGCAWTATSDAAWLTTSSSGNGSGTVNYAVSSNTGSSSRVGTLTIGGNSFTVSQQGTAAGVSLVANRGFETGTASWTQSATGGYPIITNEPALSRSGVWDAWLGGYDSGADTLYQNVTIPSGAGAVSLQFWYRIDTNETSTTTVYDTLTVSVADPLTGARRATLASFSNLNQTSGWVQSPTYDLSAFRGQTVRLVFSAVMDFSNVTNFRIDDISLSASTPPPTMPDLNQHGLTGSWYESASSGQGVEVEIFADPSSGTGSTFVSWFTFDTVIGGAERQRWYTAQGPVETGQPGAALTIYRNTGGNFNATPITDAQPVGTATLSFDTCSSGELAYQFTDGTARTGTIPLTRLTQNVTCSPTTPYPANTDFALSGNWYDPATSGQGLTVEVNPINGAFFATWYTYAPNGAGSGVAGQRWYTAQGAFAPGLRSIPVTIYDTTGGMFDTPTPPGQATVPVGTGTMAFQSCSAATFRYTFTGGTSSGLSATITLRRVGPAPPGCV